ncbi:NAD-dependent epimerase/dehydratase family protein [Pseudoalteromonas lipolytica]|jgi:UDP-glucose 4-epimerase
MLKSDLRVTLLGASGFLGSAIAEQLDAQNIPWIGVSISKSVNPKIIQISPDDEVSLVNIINDYPTVINATGSLKPKDFEERTSDSLTLFWKNVDYFTEVFKKSELKCLVHLSSAGTVYGELKCASQKNTECSVLSPISWYGRAKMFEELHYEKVSTLLGFSFLCLRVTNPFGNRQKARHGFIDVLINAVKEGSQFNYFADCDPVRDFVYAPDMSNMIVNLLKQDAKGTYNIGSGIPTKLSEIANYVKDKVVNPSLINRTLAKPVTDVLNSIVCIEKCKTMGVYSYSTDIFDYIDKKLSSSYKSS